MSKTGINYPAITSFDLTSIICGTEFLEYFFPNRSEFSVVFGVAALFLQQHYGMFGTVAPPMAPGYSLLGCLLTYFHVQHMLSISHCGEVGLDNTDFYIWVCCYSSWGRNMGTWLRRSREIRSSCVRSFPVHKGLLGTFQIWSLLVWLPHKEVEIISVQCWFVFNLSDCLNAEVSRDGNEQSKLQNETHVVRNLTRPSVLTLNSFCFLLKMKRFSFSVFSIH